MDDFGDLLLSCYKILWIPVSLFGHTFSFLDVFIFTSVGKILWDIVEEIVFHE